MSEVCRADRPRGPSRGRSDHRQLAGLGFVLPGTVLHRQARCGKPRCRCHADPPALHGPFWSWTRKVTGRTVTRRLTATNYATTSPGSTTPDDSAPWSPSSRTCPYAWSTTTPGGGPNDSPEVRKARLKAVSKSSSNRQMIEDGAVARSEHAPALALSDSSRPAGLHAKDEELLVGPVDEPLRAGHHLP